MKKILIPLLLLLVGVGGGVGAGLFLAPPKEDLVAENPCGDVVHTAEETGAPPALPETSIDAREYAKLNNQFIVPIVEDGMVTSMIVLSISLEVEAGGTERVYSHEPRLRNALLQVMFDHANIGGFDGAFTASSNMQILREALREKAIQTIGGSVLDVLITDILRQDVDR